MMQKVKEFCGSKCFTWLLIALGTMGILIYYCKNVSYMNTVWELVDEYGYLVNAAYLSGKEWGYFTNMYYGYGYSLWLVPVFFLAKTGMQVVKGAVLLNTMFIVLSFWVQIVLMSKLFKNWNRNVVVFIAFVINFYPYLIATDMKVTCECLLTFMIWFCGLLIYQALTSEKWHYYVLSGVALAYTFFVHTRAFIFLIAFFLLIAIMLIQKKISWKSFCVFVVTVSICFVLGYTVKNHIIDVIYSNDIFTDISTPIEIEESSEISVAPIATATTQSIDRASTSSTMQKEEKVKVGNTLRVSEVINKLIKTLFNIEPTHIYSIICKGLYLFIGTVGMFHLGLFVTIKSIIHEVREKKVVSAENGLKMMYAIAACLMVVALTVKSPGNFYSTSYFFYGRYYEFLLGPLVFIGLGSFIENKLRVREIVGLLLVLVGSYYFTLDLAGKLETQEFYFDSNRIPAFSFVTYISQDYREVISYCTLFVFVIFVMCIIINRTKMLRYLTPGLLLIIFLLNGHVIMENILSIQGNQYYDIASYIHTNCDEEEVYFVNGDVVYTPAYTGMQSLLVEQKLILIEQKDVECLKSGDWFVTFRYNPHIEEWEKPMSKVTETETFSIYWIE